MAFYLGSAVMMRKGVSGAKVFLVVVAAKTETTFFSFRRPGKPRYP
jgi:hypothetical protein